jgi:hypothetical protein
MKMLPYGWKKVGWVLLALSLLNLLSNLFLAHALPAESFVHVVQIKHLILSVPTFIFYYVLIFYISFWIDKKRLSDEE